MPDPPQFSAHRRERPTTDPGVFKNAPKGGEREEGSRPMKNSLRFTWRLASALILAGGLAMGILNQGAIVKLRAENRVLLDEQQEAQRLGLENREIPRLRQDADEAEK